MSRGEGNVSSESTSREFSSIIRLSRGNVKYCLYGVCSTDVALAFGLLL